MSTPAERQARLSARAKRKGWRRIGMWIPGDVHAQVKREARSRGMTLQDRIIEKLRASHQEKILGLSARTKCDCCGTGVISDDSFPIICITCELIASGERNPPLRYMWYETKVHTREDVIRKIRQLEIVAELKAGL